MINLNDYEPIAGKEVVGQLYRLAESLGKTSLVHVNSTRVGGGVAELLEGIIPLWNQLGIEARWEVITGDPAFFETTKGMHNALQGRRMNLTPAMLQHYREINAENARKFTWEADFVVVNDPQPAFLIEDMRPRAKYWIWRCHIDISRPDRNVWRYLRRAVSQYDASIFSMPSFSQLLAHPQYLMYPAIDPLSEKNRDLTAEEVQAVFDRLGVERDKPIILQVSRFDSFKDPLGVIQAFRLARRYFPCKLVLAGGEATDDPEGARIFAEVQEAARGEPDIQLLAFAVEQPPGNQRPAAGRGYHCAEIHPGGLRPHGNRGHVEGKTGDRRGRRGDRHAAPKLLYRLPGAFSRGLRLPHQVSAAPPGNVPAPGPDG